MQRFLLVVLTAIEAAVVLVVIASILNIDGVSYTLFRQARGLPTTNTVCRPIESEDECSPVRLGSSGACTADGQLCRTRDIQPPWRALRIRLGGL